MDNVKDAADKAASVVDRGVSDAVQLATHTAQDVLSRGSELWDTAKVSERGTPLPVLCLESFPAEPAAAAAVQREREPECQQQIHDVQYTHTRCVCSTPGQLQQSHLVSRVHQVT